MKICYTHYTSLYGYSGDTVLVSMGEKGAIAITKDNVYQLTVPNVTIVSTIGSGDSTVAGFYYGMMQN